MKRMFGAAILLLALSSKTWAESPQTPPSPPLAPAARCENAALLSVLGKLGVAPLGRDATTGATKATGPMKVVKSAHDVLWELQGEPVFHATCDRIEVPFADQLERPTKGQATSTSVAMMVVSKTARGAISLEIPAGLLDRKPVSVLLLDDASISVTRGADIAYELRTGSDGSSVESEGLGLGCGCERTHGVDGKVTTRKLTAANAKSSGVTLP